VRRRPVSARCPVLLREFDGGSHAAPPEKIGIAIGAVPHSNSLRDVATCVELISESLCAARRVR
jgi:hypothetical protein